MGCWCSSGKHNKQPIPANKAQRWPQSNRLDVTNESGNLKEIDNRGDGHLNASPTFAVLVKQLVKGEDDESQSDEFSLDQSQNVDFNKSRLPQNGFVYTPSHCPHTCRPIYSIRESIPVRPQTHRGSAEGYVTPTASPFGRFQLVTARSDATGVRSLTRQLAVSDRSVTEPDYCYSETVLSRMESKDSADWDFDCETGSERVTKCSLFGERNDLQGKPFVPTLNIGLVAAIAARENAYLKAKHTATEKPSFNAWHAATARTERVGSSAVPNQSSRSCKQYIGSYSPLIWKEPDCSAKRQKDVGNQGNRVREAVCSGLFDRDPTVASKTIISPLQRSSSILYTYRDASSFTTKDRAFALKVARTGKVSLGHSSSDNIALSFSERGAFRRDSIVLQNKSDHLIPDTANFAQLHTEDSTCCTELASYPYTISDRGISADSPELQ